MREKSKRIMRFFLALVMFMGCLYLNPIASYANDDVNGDVANGDVEINDKNFPDEAFRNYVKNFDIVGDRYLSKDELDRVTDISINNKSVSSLKGIEHFKNLTKLYCPNNNLEDLDISKNTELMVLDCSNNKLKSLDVSENTNLTKLWCNGNNLTNLFVGYNTDLTELNCNNNKLKNLYVGRNASLTNLWCAYNEIESLYLGYNTNLTKLGCNNNKLESLDVSKIPNLTSLYCSGNKLTSLDLSKNNKLTYLDCSDQQYNITVIKGKREFKYSEFPGKFDKEKVISPVGASFGDHALTVDNDTTREVSYKYNLGNNKEMNVKLNVTYIEFDPRNVKSMEVTTQPKKLSYTEGEKLDLTGLVVTLTDKQGLTKEVAFEGFGNYDISTNPSNGDDLTLIDNNPVTISKGSLQDETNKLTVKAKVVVPDPTTPGQVPTDRLRVTFDAGDGNTIDGTNRYKYIDVLENTPWTDAKVKEQIPASATYKDNTKEFDKWSEAVPTTGTVEAKTFIANYKAKKTAETGTNPSTPVPVGYTRVTFDAGEGNKIDGTNRYKVIDVLTGTAWDNAKVKEQIPASATYKDATKIFTEWDSTVPTAGPVEEQEFTASYRTPVVGPVNPTQLGGKPADTSKYWTVTFKSADEAKGTVDAKNTVYVLKTETKTLADITAPEKTAKAGYEFDKWEPALDANTTITGDMEVKAYFKQEATPTPQDPKVVGPIDPTDSNGGKPADTSKYWTVTFKSADEAKGTVDAKNTVYVLKTETKTLADITAPEKTAKAGYEFDKWEPALDANTTIAGDMEVKAYFKASKTPQPPTPTPEPTPSYTRYDYNPFWNIYFGSSVTNKTTTTPQPQTSVKLKLQSKLVIGTKEMTKTVDGVEQKVFMDVAPFIEKDRTMLPIRFVAEALGFNVQWDNENRTVILIDKENVVKIPVDTNKIIVNGKVYESDVKPVIRNNRTMLPIANIARALGLKDGKDFHWDGKTKEVLITREIAK